TRAGRRLRKVGVSRDVESGGSRQDVYSDNCHLSKTVHKHRHAADKAVISIATEPRPRPFEPSLVVWAAVMAEDRAIVAAGLKALAFDSRAAAGLRRARRDLRARLRRAR